MGDELREGFNAGWEAVSTFAGDQGPNNPLIDPDMARDKAYRAFQRKRKSHERDR